MTSARPEGQTQSAAPPSLSRCHDEAEHDALLDDLEHDARIDPDIQRIIFQARHLLRAKGAPTPWWAS